MTIVKVAGLEQFVGDIKRRYRSTPAVSHDPERHHAAFAEQVEGATLVDSGIADQLQPLVDAWERDPRTLTADMVTLPDGRISYRVYAFASGS